MGVHSPNSVLAERGVPADHSLDAVFDLLVNQRRRYALTCLTDHTRAIALADLAEDVAGRENEGPITEIPKETVRTIYTSLYHVHLPKLLDAGAVEYDQARDLIRISETADLVERYFSLAADGGEERDSPALY